MNSPTPVLVDFWAPWCGPCRQVAPVLEALAGEYAGRVRFVKMDVDENPATPATYRVTGIPALKVFINGEVVKEITGARPKAALAAELDDALNTSR